MLIRYSGALGEQQMNSYRTMDFPVRRKTQRPRMAVVQQVNFQMPLALAFDAE
jgi:hypothetical protein